MAYDPAVIRAIKRIGRRRGEDPRYIEGELATGIVESGLQNLPGGDADSYGFRQQRESIYGRQNLARQVNNLFDEFHQYDKGQPLGQLIADVQRPAAQYRGRYAKVLDEARRLMGSDFSGADIGSVGMSPVSSQAPSSPQVNPFDVIGGLQSSMPENPYSQTMQNGWNLLAQLWADKHSGTTPLSPSTPQPMGNVPRGGKIAGGLHEAFYNPVGDYDEGRAIGAIAGHDTHAHFGGNPAAVARIVRMAQKRGLAVRDYSPVDKVDPVHAADSWHYRFGGRGAADISGDPTALARLFRRVIHRAGWAR